jgi:hypothetical protein
MSALPSYNWTAAVPALPSYEWTDNSFYKASTQSGLRVAMAMLVLSLLFTWWYTRTRHRWRSKLTDAQFFEVPLPCGNTPLDHYFTHGFPHYAIPVANLAHWLSIVAFPVHYGVVSCQKGMPWECHIIFAVVLWIGISVDVCVASAVTSEPWFWRARRLVPGICSTGLITNSGFYLLTGTLAKLDTYTDICFVLIARECGSPLWKWAAGFAVVGIGTSQLLPNCYAARGLRQQWVSSRAGSSGESPGSVAPATVMKLLDFRLSGAILMRLQPDRSGRIIFFSPALFRFLLEDVPQSLLQFRFVTDGAGGQSNLPVRISLIVSLVSAAIGCLAAMSDMFRILVEREGSFAHRTKVAADVARLEAEATIRTAQARAAAASSALAKGASAVKGSALGKGASAVTGSALARGRRLSSALSLSNQEAVRSNEEVKMAAAAKTTKFCGCCVYEQDTVMVQQQKLRAAFDLIDTDSDGFIDKTELGLLFQALNMDSAKLDATFKFIDTDEDLKISFDEFSSSHPYDNPNAVVAAVAPGDERAVHELWCGIRPCGSRHRAKNRAAAEIPVWTPALPTAKFDEKTVAKKSKPRSSKKILI